MELKVGDRFLHRNWGDAVCEIIEVNLDQSWGRYRYRCVDEKVTLPYVRPDGTRAFSDPDYYVVKLLTDDPKRDSIAPSETDLYPPWRETT